MKSIPLIAAFCAIAFILPIQLAVADGPNPTSAEQTLTSYIWKVQIDSQKPSELRFFPNGTAQGPFRWNWVATGQKSFTINGDTPCVFDDTFSHFIGHFTKGGSEHTTTGLRLAAVPTPTSAEQALTQKVANTYWSWEDAHMPDKTSWFRLNADGTATAGWNNNKHSWVPLNDSTITFDITARWQGQRILSFNPELTEATGTYFDGKAIFHRLTGPNRSLVMSNPPPESSPVASTEREETSFAATPSKQPETRIDELIERKSVIVDDLFGELDRHVPASIRDYLSDLRENLLDEGARHPIASQQAYALSAQFCNGLIGAYDEREKMAGRLRDDAPSQAAGAPITMKVHPNWIDYLRERDEAAAATHNNTIETPFAKMNILQWKTRAVELRRTLDDLYARFRAAARQPVTPK
jgi:hypothetical protein